MQNETVIRLQQTQIFATERDEGELHTKENLHPASTNHVHVPEKSSPYEFFHDKLQTHHASLARMDPRRLYCTWSHKLRENARPTLLLKRVSRLCSVRQER